MSAPEQTEPKRSSSHHASKNACQRCGAPISVVWRLPSACKECGTSFDARPRHIGTAAFLIAIICAIAVMVLLRQLMDITSILAIVGLLTGFASFSLSEVLMFHLGIVRLTNVNAPDDSPSVSLSPADPGAMAEAEKAIRAQSYAGSSKQTRVAQGIQLRESLHLARSLRQSNADAPQKTEDHKRHPSPVGATTPRMFEKGPRCSLLRIDADDDAAVRRASELSASITREHFDPLVGVEQNTYMIDHFHSPFAIREQIEGGYEYCMVFSATDQGQEHPIGIVATRPQPDRVLHIGRFHLIEEERGKGYSHAMMRRVRQHAKTSGCSIVTTHILKNNFQAILACEHLGFRRTGERSDEIGSGFVVDNLIYELELQ